MSDPTFGISITRIDNEPRPALAANMSVVGIVSIAPDANATAFPLNEPVMVFSDDVNKLALLGAVSADNLIRDAIDAVNQQLGEFQVAARCVVVRVAKGETDDLTISNIVGNSTAGTGVHALLAAGEIHGFTPRLVMAPGYTGQFKRGVTNIVINAGGSGYGDGEFEVTGTGGGGTGFTGTATVEDGAVTEISIDDPGSGYTGDVDIVFTALTGGGTGADATATVGALANPVVAALPGVLEKLLGVAVVDGPTANVIDWRETIQSHRVIPVHPGVIVDNGAGGTINRPLAPRVIGIGVRRDHAFQGRPFHSWANQPVQGILGPQRSIRFSLTDGATEGQTLLSQNVGVLIRGQMGVEQAIASGGFVFVGTDTCSEDTLWRFYNQVRGRDYIHLMLLQTLRFYLGRFNITLHAVQAIINTMNMALRSLQADQDILGYKVGFSKDQNSPEELRLGRLTVSFAAEEPAVLRYLGIQSARYRPALDALLDNLIAQLDTVA